MVTIKFLEYFFAEADAKFFASLGFNAIRYELPKTASCML